MFCAEVPKERFPPQSPGYKPADDQSHSAELRRDQPELTTHTWHKALVLLMRPRAIMAKSHQSYKKKCCHMLESPDELSSGKHDFRGSWLWLKSDILTTKYLEPFLIFLSINKVLTGFTVWIEDGQRAWKNPCN